MATFARRAVRDELVVPVQKIEPFVVSETYGNLG
jgi:hypothetical protein